MTLADGHARRRQAARPRGDGEGRPGRFHAGPRARACRRWHHRQLRCSRPDRTERDQTVPLAPPRQSHALGPPRQRRADCRRRLLSKPPRCPLHHAIDAERERRRLSGVTSCQKRQGQARRRGGQGRGQSDGVEALGRPLFTPSPPSCARKHPHAPYRCARAWAHAVAAAASRRAHAHRLPATPSSPSVRLRRPPWETSAPQWHWRPRRGRRQGGRGLEQCS